MKNNRQQPKHSLEFPAVRLVPARPPLSRLSHGLLGSAMIVLLLVLFILALVIRQWQADVTAPSVAVTTASLEPVSFEISSPEVMSLALPGALERRGLIVAGVDQPVRQINPLYAVTPAELDACDLIFESLVQLDSDGQAQPELAAQYAFDPALRKIRFELAVDHTYPDGSAVTAQDVRWTYQLLLADSYDGPLRGFLSGIESVDIEPDTSLISFTLADWVNEPDMAWFTVGILKADAYPADLERVFELGLKNPAPLGSGAFQWSESDDASTTLALRADRQGPIQTIQFNTLSSQAIFSALSEQTIDLAYVAWDAKLTSRLDDLPVYRFNKALQTSCYVLINRLSEGAELLKSAEQQNIVLSILAGQAIDDTMLIKLDEIASKSISCFYYQGIDELSAEQNKQQVIKAVQPLTDIGLKIAVTPADWPDLASRALEGRYDLMVLPRPANEVLPAGSKVINLRWAAQDPLEITGLSFSNVLSVQDQAYALLTHRRLENLNINPNQRPLSVWPLSWTCSLDQLTLLTPEALQ